MKKVSSLFAGMSKSLNFTSSRSKKVFKALDAKDYQQMVSITANMNAGTFLKEIRHPQTEQPLLNHICEQGDLEALEHLVTLPYFSQIVNDDSENEGWTPLLYSAIGSSREQVEDTRMFEILLENGAQLLRPKKSDGMTTLHLAAVHNDVHLLDLIISKLDHKSTINVPNGDGWTPAHFCCHFDNFDSLNLLLENGADMAIKNDLNLTSFDELVRNDHLELLGCVYSDQGPAYAKNRDVKSEGSFGLIHLAAGLPTSEILLLLIAEGESINQICNVHDQAAPLHFAVLGKSLANAKILLGAGANANQRDNNGNTPMHIAVANKDLPLVRLLDEYNADARVPNGNEESAIDLAIVEDIKDIKLHFMSQTKYANVNFNE